MTSGVIADSIVNLCGAIGLCVAMVTLYRRDAKSPLTRRLLLAFGVIALLFFLRGAAWWSGNALLDRISLIPAALVPLGALIVTEGILRRHAPRQLKSVIVLGGIVLGLGGALGLERFTTLYSLLLSLFQLAGFATCGLLLATRDRTTLMASENRSIGRLAVGALIVIPFIATDFQVLAPDIPVRLGALGALLVVTAILIAGGGAETRRQALLMTALRLSSSALLGAAAAFVSPDVDGAQVMRFCAIAISGVLTIGLMADALRAYFESQVPGVLDSVAASAARTRDQLIAELARHPMFESARRYREGELAAYDPPLLRDFLSTRRVLRRAEAPWGLTASDPAVERAVSLMAANSATHLIILSADPIDVIVLAVPLISADPATETALALVRRLLALTPEAE
jgi:multisubunit Na+/H+ antiporter MnhG subunit